MLLPIVLLAVTAEPAPAVPSPRPPASEAAMSLQPVLDVQTRGRHVVFTVTVRNAGSEPAELRFSDAGTLQILITKPDGTQLYDSRAGRMFAAVMSTVAIAPNESATFRQEWDAPPDVRGPVVVRAVVRSIPPLTVSKTIDVGGS